MKTLKKTLAVVSSVAVVAAAVAVATSFSASADGVNVSLGSYETTYDGSTTTINATLEITGDAPATAVGFGIIVNDSEITSMEQEGTSSVLASDDGVNYWYNAAWAHDSAVGEVIDTLYIMVELSDDDIAALENGDDVSFSISGTIYDSATGEISASWSGSIQGKNMSFSDGIITIKAASSELATDATTTTTDTTTTTTTAMTTTTDTTTTTTTAMTTTTDTDATTTTTTAMTTTTTAMTTTTTVTTTTAVTETEAAPSTGAYCLGDPNGDGAVNALDAHKDLVAGVQYALRGDYGLTDEEFAAADVNGDGIIDAIDAHYILLYTVYDNLGKNATWEDIIAMG